MTTFPGQYSPRPGYNLQSERVNPPKIVAHALGTRKVNCNTLEIEPKLDSPFSTLERVVALSVQGSTTLDLGNKRCHRLMIHP